MPNRNIGEEDIKNFIHEAHIKRSEMFHSIIKFTLSELKNLVMKRVTLSQKFNTALH
jgi:hypothetical protein